MKMNKKRNRSYSVEMDYDYFGVGALGDKQYDDGYDKWDDIRDVFDDSGLDVPIRRNHEDPEVIGTIRKFMLDHGKKQVYVAFNEDDLYSGIEIEDFNGVSPTWVVDEEDKIVGIDHFAVGNGFYPKCPNNTCNVTRKRGFSKLIDNETKPDSVESEEKVPTEEVVEDKEKIELKKQVEELEKKIVGLESTLGKVLEPSKKKEKLELKPKKGVQSDVKKGTSNVSYDPFDIGRNTEIIMNRRGRR